MKKRAKTVAKKTSLSKSFLYALAGLLAFVLVVSGFIYISRPSTKPPISPTVNTAPSTPGEVIQECDTPCRMDVGFDQVIDTGQKKVRVKFHGRDAWFLLSGRIDDRIPSDFFSAGEAEFTSPQGEPSVHVQIKKAK